MISKVSDLDARKRFEEILEDVCHEGKRYVVERDGQPMAAMVPFWQFEQWLKRRERFSGILKATWTRNRTGRPSAITKDIKDALKAAHKTGKR